MNREYQDDDDFGGTDQLADEHARINAEDDLSYEESYSFSDAANHLKGFGGNNSVTGEKRDPDVNYSAGSPPENPSAEKATAGQENDRENDDEPGDEESIVFDDTESGLAPIDEDDDDDDEGLSVVENELPEVQSSGIMSVVRPGGVYNKKLFIIVGGLSLIALMFFGNFKSTTKEIAKKTADSGETVPTPMTINAESIVPTSGSDYITSNGSSVNLNSNTNPADQPILGSSDANMIQQASTLNGGVPNSPGGQTQTTTETQTFVTPPSNGGGATYPQQQTSSSGNGSSSTMPAPTPRGGKVVLKAGQRTEEQGDLQQVQIYNNQNQQQPAEEDPFAELKNKIAYGSRIQLELVDPVRSGVETNVQARTVTALRSSAGEVLIAAGAAFELTFQPEEINGRVLAREIFRVMMANGQIMELKGNVKGADGFTGLTGKVIKQSGGSNIGRKILGIGTRIGGTALGGLGGGGLIGTAGQEAQSEMRNVGNNDSRISYSDKIVEVRAGTRFLLVIGKN